MEKNGLKIKHFWLMLACVIILSAGAVTVSQLVRIRTQTTYRYYYNNLTIGDIAEESIVADSSFDIVDFDATEELHEMTLAEVYPIFTVSLEKSQSILNLFADEKQKNLYSPIVYDIAYDVLYKLMENGLFDYQEIATQVSHEKTYITISNSDKKVNIWDTIHTGNLSSWVETVVSNYSGVTEIELEQAKEIIINCAVVNTYYNEMETDLAYSNAERIAPTKFISISKGQILVEKDHVITQEQLDLLLMIAAQQKIDIPQIVGQFMFVLVCFALEFYIFYSFVPEGSIHLGQYIVILTLSLLTSFFGTYFLLSSFTFANIEFIGVCIPVCFVPVFMAMVTNRKRIGFTSAVMIATASAVLPGSNIYTFFFCWVCGSLCVYSVKFVNKRLDAILQVLISLAINLALSSIFLLSGVFVFSSLFTHLVMSAFVTLGSIILVNALLPVVEKLLNLPTVFRLSELAYGDSAVLKTLANAAPGTFNHCRQVAELAQAAAEEVGANALLAKVGGLYHDIGKIDHPEYFVENQNGSNKHDDLNPSLSASIIKSHIKTGAEKGKEAGLPQEVVDIIAQHHGNDVIQYFYLEAKRENDEDERVEKADYCYHGEIPSSRECAIVMLADGVEASVRTIQEPTAAKFSKQISQIVSEKFSHGQLKNCSLTLHDLDVISQSFLKTLSAMYHSRIEYPDEDEN